MIAILKEVTFSVMWVNATRQHLQARDIVYKQTKQLDKANFTVTFF